MLKFGKKGIITFLVAALAMVFASGAMAEPVTTSADLKAKLEKGENVELGGNIDDAGTITIPSGKSPILDLKGKSIEMNGGDSERSYLFIIDGGKLTINDTAGNGTIKNTGSKARVVQIGTSSIGASPSNGTGGELVVNAGTLEVEAKEASIAAYANVLSGDSKEIKSILTIEDGATLKGGVALFGKGAEVNVNGGKIIAKDYAISGNGTVDTKHDNGGTVININGGEITGGECAIYHPQDGVLNISGGTITGYDGVQLKSGKLVMTGGVIKATGTKPEEYPDSSNGSVVTACAISLISNKSYTGDINVNVSGKAELESTKACAVFSKITVGDNKVNKIEISGGSFRGGDQALLLEDAANIDVSLTGGSYSSDPSDYVDKTIYTIVEKDGLFTVKGKAAPIVTPVKPALPDGTSDDVTAEIKPATAVVLGVDTTKSAITEETKAAAITETMKVISADITSKDLTVNEETGAVEISVATASEAAQGLLKDNETLASKDIAPLPVFTATVDEGKTAMVSYQLTSSALKAKTAEEVRVMKILSSTTAGEFKYASEITADMDGKFTIQNTDGKIHSGALEAGTDYLLTLFIKDGSSFDLDGAKDGSITDPAAIFSTTTTEPQHGSSSSGCNGGFGALALLGLALVPMFYGKKR